MNEIRVKITAEQMIDQPINVGDGYIISVLKKAGIPIKGVLIFSGLERGSLAIITNKEEMCTEFVWRNVR